MQRCHDGIVRCGHGRLAGLIAVVCPAGTPIDARRAVSTAACDVVCSLSTRFESWSIDVSRLPTDASSAPSAATDVSPGPTAVPAIGDTAPRSIEWRRGHAGPCCGPTRHAAHNAPWRALEHHPLHRGGLLIDTPLQKLWRSASWIPTFFRSSIVDSEIANSRDKTGKSDWTHALPRGATFF